ncbi:hypothetical protein EGW08_020935 [Elysia chlorotica]|uniref:Uncharacterized protein n=1 Tax=Elysia chlorotica TaxID=188477 RepID=A0A3S1AT09_ELYCH|nr:hypothetical protein EGW08_020935 [Elysia chlorotica]
MARYYEISFPRGKKGMWLRQNKMHVGKWHVKTLLLVFTLALVVFFYLRVQTPQESIEGVQGGSRARRRGLIQVHAFGAKPYKSLALTRRTLAQMRNKTLAAAKNKRKPVRKSTPSSLSVAQMPSRRFKPNSTEKKVVLAKNIPRNYVPSKNRSSIRLEASKRGTEQARRVQSESTLPRKSESGEQSMRSRDKLYPPNRSEMDLKSRPAPSRLSLSKQKESDDVVKGKAETARQPGSNNSSPVKSPSRDTVDRNESQKKRSKGSNDITDDDNDDEEEDEDEEDEKDDKTDDDKEEAVGRSTKQKPVVGPQAKGKEYSDGRNKILRFDSRKSPVYSRDSGGFKSDQKVTLLPSKSEGTNDREKAARAARQKDDSKSDGKNRENDRPGMKVLRAGLAEDRPKSSPRKSPPSETKKKQNDIKLEEDRLDADVHAVNKTGTKDASSPEKKTWNGGPTVHLMKRETETTDHNETSAFFNESSSNVILQASTPGNQFVKSDKEKKAILDTVTAEDLAEIGLSSENADSATGNVPRDTLLFNSTHENDIPQSSKERASVNDINNERFFIEGQLQFGNDGKSQGIANVRISRGKNGDTQDPTDSAKGTGPNPSPDNQANDAASNIWNVLHAVLGSQRNVEKSLVQDTNSEKNNPPVSTQLPAKSELPVYEYKTGMSDNTARDVYGTRDYVTGNDYYAQYQDGDDSDEGEYGQDDDEYSDASEYDGIPPESDVAYYQNYDNDPGDVAPYPQRNRMYPSVIDRDRTAQRLRFRDSWNPNNFDQVQNARDPPYAQRRFGSLMNIPDSRLFLSRPREDVGDRTQKAIPTVNNQNTYTVGTNGLDQNDRQEQTPIDPGIVANPTPPASMNSAPTAGPNLEALPTASDKPLSPAPFSAVVDNELKAQGVGPQSEETASRVKMQALARDRMQRYAALSARVDPMPVEIKPLSRLQKLQKIHAIPQ